MDDPTRLSNPRSKSPASLRRLLRAGRSEVPDPERLRGVATRLGFGTVAPPATPGVAAKTSAAGGLTIAASSSAKVGALVLLVLAAGGGLLATRNRTMPLTAAAMPAASTSAEGPQSPLLPPADAVIEPASVEEPPLAQRTAQLGSAQAVVRTKPAITRYASVSPSSVQGVAPAASVVVAPPAVETEAGLVQQAQRALADNPTRALELADRADDRFPSGALVQEREVVAIEALVQLGRHDDARARAGHFLRRFPGSVHQRHIETLLGFDTGAREP